MDRPHFVYPPAPGSSIMGSREPKTAESAAPRGPFTLGKSLSAGPGHGPGRCHGWPHGPPGAPGGDLQPTAPQQPSGFCPQPTTCLATQTGHMVPTGQAFLPTALMPRALEPCPSALFHPEAAIKDNTWPRGGPFTKGRPGPPAHSGGDARGHCQLQTPSCGLCQ